MWREVIVNVEVGGTRNNNNNNKQQRRSFGFGLITDSIYYHNIRRAMIIEGLEADSPCVTNQ